MGQDLQLLLKAVLSKMHSVSSASVLQSLLLVFAHLVQTEVSATGHLTTISSYFVSAPVDVAIVDVAIYRCCPYVHTSIYTSVFVGVAIYRLPVHELYFVSHIILLYIYIYVCIYMCICLYIYTYMCVYVSIYVYTYMCICLYIYAFIYIMYR